MREVNLHDRFLDDAMDEIVNAIEECIAMGESEIYLIHGYAHGDVIKRWIWSPQFADALQKINVKIVNRSLMPRNVGATQIQSSEII